MKNNIKIILRSLFITTIMSLFFGSVMALLTQTIYGFIAGTLIGFIGQIIGFYLWNTYLINKTRIAQMQYMANIESVAAVQRVVLNCAHCRVENVVNILLDRSNEFVCSACNNKNIVMIEFSTAQKSEPLDIEPNDLFAPIIKDLTEPIEFKS